MTERYSRLFSLPQNLYAMGCPVIVAAGALLKDNQTGRVLVQLKLKSISNRSIAAVKVALSPFDVTGNPLEGPVVHDYLDLNISRDGEFGAKIPIFLANRKTRSYTVSVTQVVFADHSVWDTDGEAFAPLEEPSFLRWEDDELRKQYQIRFGIGGIYEPRPQKDLWLCTCGAWNHEGESCHLCRHTLPELQALDLAELEKDKQARLAQEEADRAARARKTKRIAAIAAVAIVAVVLLCGWMKKNTAYHDAIVLMEAGEYDSAIEAFELLENFRKSPEKILETKYRQAMDLADQEKYQKAIEALSAIEEYGDSREQIQRLQNTLAEIEEAKRAAKYNQALELLKEHEDEDAYLLFEELGDYRDSREYLAGFHELHVSMERKFNKKTTSRTYYHYNTAGQVESEDFQSSKVKYTMQYRYDANGNKVRTDYTYLSGDYGRGSVSSYQYYYDENNRLVEQKETLRSGSVTRTFFQWYNESGELISPDVTQRMDGLESATCIVNVIDEAGNTIRQQKDRIDAKGNFGEQPEYTYTYTYDAKGNILKRIYSGNGYYSYKEYVCKYENGRLVKDEYGDSCTYYPNGQLKTAGGKTYTLGLVYTPDLKTQ